MGADIHLYVEKKVNGVWEAIRGANTDIARFRDYAERARTNGEEEKAIDYEKMANDIESGEKLKSAEDEYDREHYAPTTLVDWAYDGRNYNLFAMLADVRNGRGFAGVYTGEGFNPIADPKGAPSDMSSEIKSACEYWEGDGHSHSWFTVKELLDYDWEQDTVIMKAGMYRMDTPLEELKQNTETAKYKDCAGDFYTETIPKLNELAGEDKESVRIVFWFDN